MTTGLRATPSTVDAESHPLMSDAKTTDKTTDTPAPEASPKPARRGGSKYPPTPLEAVRGCLDYFDEAAAHLKDPEAHPPADIAHLLRGLPQGSITEAAIETRPEGPVIAWRIGERNPRFTPPAGFLILRVLPLCGGVPFIDTNRKGGRECHYVEVLADGFTMQRLMAGAEEGEAVRLLGDHHDLCPWSLRIEPGNAHAKRDRRGAIKLALARHERNAADWGLTDLLPRARFERLLRGSFRLFDAEHGRHLLRPLKASI